MKHIVIVGGGYAGVAAGLHLRKHLKGNGHKITLINKHHYHIFTPSLYEVATSASPQKNIAIPLRKIFPDTVELIKGVVKRIDTKEKKVYLEAGEPIAYDYLIMTLGSQAAYYGIPGLAEHAIPLKTLNNAAKIQETINGQCLIEHGKEKKLEVVIGGGGFAGTELAGEILNYRRRMVEDNMIVRDCINITIIQGSNRLLKELDAHVSRLAHKRLHGKGVTLAFGGHVKEVTAIEVITDDGKKYPYGIFIWTGGVEANHIAKESDLVVNKRGAIEVESTLQMKGSDHVFAAGDIAGFVDPKTEKPVPNVAQVAEEQGLIAAENVIRSIEQKPLKPYTFRHYGYIVPLKGRFAVAELMGGIHLDGLLGWALQQVVFLWYLMKILPDMYAFRRWNVFQLDLEQ
jgi:NADH:ubiquinone reductase (H+-translocating)